MNAPDPIADAALDNLELLFAVHRRTPDAVTRGQLRLAVVHAAIVFVQPVSATGLAGDEKPAHWFDRNTDGFTTEGNA
jgi:hypothetical protein